MKFHRSLAILSLSLLLCHCGPESGLNPTTVVPPQPLIPVGEQTAFVNDLRGSRLDYQDRHGEYTYKLSKLGTYTFTSLSQNKRQSDQRSGIYIYQKTGPKTGRLIFDLNETWDLKFVSSHRAIAKTAGDVRSYTFEFEWM